MRISKDNLVADIIQKYPSTMKILEKYRIACRDCHFTRKETLKDAARARNIPVAKITMEIEHFLEMHQERKK